MERLVVLINVLSIVLIYTLNKDVSLGPNTISNALHNLLFRRW